MKETPRVICVGEALIELTRGPDGAFTAACAGDSFNTAVYLARAGLSVGFATAVGDDPYSDSIVSLALAEGLAGQSDSARAGPPAGIVLGRAWTVRRTREPRLARRRAGAGIVRASRLDADRAKPRFGAADLFFRHHVVALFE